MTPKILVFLPTCLSDVCILLELSLTAQNACKALGTPNTSGALGRGGGCRVCVCVVWGCSGVCGVFVFWE